MYSRHWEGRGQTSKIRKEMVGICGAQERCTKHHEFLELHPEVFSGTKQVTNDQIKRVKTSDYEEKEGLVQDGQKTK